VVVVAVLGATLAHLLVARGVDAFSPHDELLYLDQATELAHDGPGALRSQVRAFLATPARWLYPPPTRWGHHLAAGAAVAVWGDDFRSLARLSTLTSVAAVVLAALLARRLGGNVAAGAAAALLGSSPLWLHLGRRALADAPHSALGLAAVWAFLEAARPGARWRSQALAAVLLTATVATKETGLVLLPLLGAVHLARAEGRGHLRPLALLVAGGLLAWLGFSLLAGSGWAYARVLEAVRAGTAHNAYVILHQQVPLHRPFLDLTLLAPTVMLAAPAALASGLRAHAPLRRQVTALAALVLPALVLVGVVSGVGQNARFLLLGDALLRIAVAVWLARLATTPRRLGVVVALVGATVLLEGWLFWRVFVEGRVYDPVSSALWGAF